MLLSDSEEETEVSGNLDFIGIGTLLSKSYNDSDMVKKLFES